MKLLIDTDTASDDAVALLMALRHPGVEVEAITVVAGNVPLEQAVQNACYTVELCDADVPVRAGRDGPLLVPLSTAQHVHGEDGMGDLGLPLHGRVAHPGHAVDTIIEVAQRLSGELVLVALGPLSNVAVALLRAPELADQLKGCVVMGGTGEGHGNITPVAEYNFWADPHAAKIVLDSGLPVTMVGWDISRRFATFDDTEAQALREVGTPLATFCVDIQRVVAEFARRSSKLAGFDLPDPIAMAIALDPAVATDTQDLYVDVVVEDGTCRGQTIVDHNGSTGRPPNVRVVRRASEERFKQMLRDAVARQ